MTSQMEVKKNHKSKTEMNSSLGAIRDFIGELKAEIKRINWTSVDELKVYTRIVVTATFALGLGIFLTDLCIRTFLDGMGVIAHWIGG